MTRDEKKQLVISLFESFAKGENEKVFSLFSDSFTWWTAGRFGLSGRKSKAELAKTFEELGVLLKGPIRVTTKAFTIEGDRVAVEAESHAERIDGRVYNNEYHFLFEIRDGQVQSVREYFDTMHANDVFCTPIGGAR
jgi:ketosteroid isomerase-like protein